MPVLEVAGVKIVYEDGYYPRVRPDGSVTILPITPKAAATNSHRTGPTTEATALTRPGPNDRGALDAADGVNHESARSRHALGIIANQGCHLGSDVWLEEDDQLFCFRRRSSLESASPEAVAVARGGQLYVDGVAIQPSKGSVLQLALRRVQNKIGDLSPTSGGPTSLDAWKYWYVRQEGRYGDAQE